MEQQLREVAAWAKAESQRLEEKWPKGSRIEGDLIATWKRLRPKMAAALGEAEALEALAHVLTHQAIEATIAYQKAGMPPPDAAELAEAEWLLKTPESEDEDQASPLLPLLARTTSSPILTV